MVVEVGEAVKQAVGLFKGSRLVAADAFRLEKGEEVLFHSAVLAIFPPGHGGRNAVFLSQVKARLRGVLKSLVAVELQLRSDLLFFPFKTRRMVSSTRFTVCRVPVL